MKVFHRLTINADGTLISEASKMGIELESGLNFLTVQESDLRWPEYRRLAVHAGASDYKYARFSKAEYLRASTFQVLPTWHFGFPQPEEEYLDLVYNLDNFCKTCGLGKVQKEPFRILREPKWGRKNIFQINWVFDEYFVRKEFFEAILSPLGLKSGVVLTEDGAGIHENVVQLLIDRAAEMDVTNLAFERCSECGRRKYNPISGDYFPYVNLEGASLVKTSEEFGSAKSSFRGVICGSSFRNACDRAGERGVSFVPCRTSRLDT